MIVVTGLLRIAPDKVEAWRPHARRTLEATRQEKGCLVYAYAEDVLEPGLIRIVERWADWPSLEAHGKAPHMTVWRAALKEIGVIEREVTATEAGETRAL